MVMPSFSIVAPLRPHIGSEVGGGTRFGAIPESQWPALPAQHGIVSDDALAIGSSGAIKERATRKHRKHNVTLESCLCLVKSFAAIVLTYWLGLAGKGLRTSFILPFGQVFEWAEGSCCDGAHRIHLSNTQKQCALNREVSAAS